jgi:hypothetical protein
MMVDNTENNEFRELLSEYSAPIADDGFSKHILKQAHAPRNVGAIKTLMIGMAALLATFMAIPQLGKLQHLLASIQLPKIALPVNMLESASIPTLTIFALLALMIISLGSSFLFSSDI